MRYSILVLVFLAGVAHAEPPNGYRCAPGSNKRDVGCTCPAGYADKRDKENVAVCVAVAPAGPSYSQLFIKAVEDHDFVKAGEYASKIDGSADRRAADALTKSFDTWLAKRKGELPALLGRGSCKATELLANDKIYYIDLWEKLMAQLDKRNPAIQAGAAARSRIEKAVEPLITGYQTCVAEASKTDGTATLEADFTRSRAMIDKCAQSVPTATVTAKVVIDGDGRLVQKSFASTPPAGKRSALGCVSSWFGSAGRTFAKQGRGYAATLVVEIGGKSVTAPPTTITAYECAPGTSLKGTGCKCPTGYVGVIDKDTARCKVAPHGAPTYQHVEVMQGAIAIKQAIQFDTNTARIKPESFPLLDEIVAVLRDHPKMTIRIEGHTDNRGADDYNLKLSQDRADAVKAHLVGKGIAGSRLEAKGFGETKPVDINSTERGRAANRRIDFVILSR